MKRNDKGSRRLRAVPSASKSRKPKYVRLLVDAMQFFEDPRGITIPWFVRYCHVMRSVPLEQSLRLAQRVLSHGISTGVVAKRRNYVSLVEYPTSQHAASRASLSGAVPTQRPVSEEDRNEKVQKRQSGMLVTPPRRHRSRSRERRSHHHIRHHRGRLRR